MILMALSILMLGGFLFYFLKAEYNKEKQSIILEERDKAFVNLFANIRKAGPIEWEHDSLGNDILFLIESFTNDSIVANVDLVESKDKHFKFIDHEASRTELRTVNETSDSIVAVFESYNDSLPGSIKIEQSIKFNKGAEADTTVFIDIKGDADQFVGNGFLQKDTVDVPRSRILMGIWPQMLFSFLLLVLISLSYYLISRSLAKAHQLSLMRNELISNMSHELKTPVSTVSVALEALSEFDAINDPELRKEYIEISRSEVARLGMLVDKALNISLFEQGKFVYDKQMLDLDSEIQNIVRSWRVQLDKDNVHLSYEKSGIHFGLFGDKTHVTNVVHNLLENALKYSGDQKEVSIRLSEKEEILELKVSDNGIGIPEAFQSRVFDKFFRVPQGDRHNVKGHGLGLSYVKQVVEKHEGTIRLESTPGKGSSFIIEWPKQSNE